MVGEDKSQTSGRPDQDQSMEHDMAHGLVPRPTSDVHGKHIFLPYSLVSDRETEYISIGSEIWRNTAASDKTKCSWQRFCVPVPSLMQKTHAGGPPRGAVVHSPIPRQQLLREDISGSSSFFFFFFLFLTYFVCARHVGPMIAQTGCHKTWRG